MADSKIRPENITPVQQMISSCTGALLSSVFVTPLDVVKIRLQAQEKVKLTHRCFLYCNGFAEELCCSLHSSSGNVSQSYWYRLQSSGQLTGMMDAFVKITRAEGIRSLWSGLPPTLLMAVPATVVYFTMYDQIRYFVIKQKNYTIQPVWLPAAAGGSARVIAATLISPLELVRTKMQAQRHSYVEIGKAVKNQIVNQGLRSMWKGLGPTLLRDVPFSSSYWLSYELIKKKFNQQTPTFWFSFSAGATAGTIAALLTIPFDVVKTHRQIELGEEMTSRNGPVSTYSLLKKLYQSNGYRALFAGIVPRIVKIAPACAVMISTYEYGKKFFHKYNISKAASTF